MSSRAYSDHLYVDLSDKKPSLHASRSLEKGDLKLPFAGKVTMVKSQFSFHIATVFGIPLYVNSGGCTAKNSEYMVPAWLAKTAFGPLQCYRADLRTVPN